MFAVGGCVLLLGVPSAVYMRQTQQEEQLREELETAKDKLAGIEAEALSNSKRESELNASLVQAGQQTDTLRDGLSPDVISPEVDDALLAAAAESNVHLVRISASHATPGAVLGVPVSQYGVVLEVSGKVTGIRAFIAQLGDIFPTGVVRQVDLSSSNTTSDNTPTKGSVTLEISTMKVMNE